MKRGLEAIRNAVQARAGEIIEWAKTLVGFPSENRPPDGGEAAVQEFISEECRKGGLAVDVFSPDEIPGIQEHPSWLPGRNYSDGRKDVVARWTGSAGGKSILFSSHIDVAPFEPDAWKVCRPYEPLIKDGRLYGRGSADMKGGMAASFWALRILKEMGFKPAGDILFESVVDEEFAGGNGALAARLRGHNADMAVVPEPSRMRICPASMGAFLGDLILTGKAGIPFMGEVANPINGAARVIELFSEWQNKWREKNSHPLFKGPGMGLKILLWRIDSVKPGEFTQMGTPLVTKISWIVWSYPGMTEDEFYRRFRSFWQEHAQSDAALVPFRLELKRDFHYVKPWETPVESPAVKAAVKAFEQYAGKATVAGQPYSCDLAIYGEAGNMPSISFGPRGDNLHAPDEWVEVEDLMKLACIYALLAVSWCG